MRRSWIVIALSGCSFHSSSSPQGPDGNAPPDGMIEMHDAAAGCVSFSSYTDTCVLDLAMPMSIAHDQIYDTGRHILADFPLLTNATTIDQQIDVSTSSGPMNVILASTFSISSGATLHIVGDDAFGVIVGAAVALDGDIDGSPDLPNALALLAPAGAVDAMHCSGSTPATPATHANGAGGGGGGGFRGNGGQGQAGDQGNSTGGSQGMPIATMPAGVRGGCPGGAGGPSSQISSGGAGGGGGAGVYLASGVSITIRSGASINVGGGGGGGGNAVNGGGGGGGTGGMIVLESTSIALQGTLAANGGGGGGGAGNLPGGAGQTGSASSSAADGAPAHDPGGAGADGAAGSTANGEDDGSDQPNAGGGGGGGAGGFIELLTLNSMVAGGSTMSPK